MGSATKLKTHIIADRQAEELAKKPETFTWLEVLKEQPPEGWGYWMRPVGYFATFIDKKHSRTIDFKLPFPIGSIVGMKERFRLHRTTDMRSHFIEYMDGSFVDINHETARKSAFALGIWYSSITAPDFAIRHKYKATDVRVCRVGDVSLNDMIAMGVLTAQLQVSASNITLTDTVRVVGVIGAICKWEFKQWFNARYSRPRPRTKNGEITHYECWVYSLDGEFQKLIKDSPHYDCEKYPPTWKGLPLKAWINPYIALTTGARQ